MKPVYRFQDVCAMVVSIVMIMSASLYSAVNPTMVEFFDNSDNHLITMKFNYNATGVFIGRSVYMADGTFVRDVVAVTDATGNRQETSLDFNGDTSFVTRLNPSGAATSVTIQDQFKLDHVGGAVSYPTTEPLNNYLLTYQNGDFASRIVYDMAADGTPAKVLVYNNTNELEYYGTFSTVGVKNSSRRLGGSPQAVIVPRGSAGIDIRLHLTAASNVKCRLMTLSGRVAGVLLDESVPKGNFLRSIRSSQKNSVSSGVYLIVVSVNDKVVSSSKYLSQAARGGVK